MASGVQPVQASISYTVKIEDMGKHSDLYSPCYMIQNIPWRINLEIDIPENRVGFYMAGTFKNKSEIASKCRATVQYRLTRYSLLPDHVSGDDDGPITYSSDVPVFGERSFIQWQHLKDPANSFVKDGAVTFEARLSLEILQGARADDYSLSMPKVGLASLLECAICLEKYVRPKLLSCGHTFCEECLDQLTASVITCPICRTTTNCQQGVDKLPNDLKTCALLEGLEQRFTHCSACGEESSVTCLKCQLNLCKTCLLRHRQAAGVEPHTVVEKDEIIICRRHECVSSHVCADCKLYVCSLCRIGPCLGHICKEVGLAIQSLVGPNAEAVQLLEEFFVEIRQDQSAMYEQAKSEMLKQRDKVIRLVCMKSKQLEKELSELNQADIFRTDCEEAALKNTFDLFLNTSPAFGEGVPQYMLEAVNTTVAGHVPVGSISRVTFTPTDDVSMGTFHTVQETRESCVIAGIEEIFRNKICQGGFPVLSNTGRRDKIIEVKDDTEEIGISSIFPFDIFDD